MQAISHSSFSAADLHRAARRRVGMKMGLAVHALVFVLVNAGLWLLNSAQGGHFWAVWPLAGWGLGLAIHATVIALVLSGGAWKQRLIERELQSLQRRS